ncbi:MAG: radical SAM protein, partial [Candidatus Izemoplasmataceae bacterium]
GMSDPYVHMEKDLGLMKQALKAIHDHAHGISVLTKSAMILRDMDLYKAIHQRAKAIVQFTVTTPYDAIARIIEPRVTLPSKRFETLKAFSDQGMTTGIWMTPILPFITDTPDAVRLIVKKAKAAGVTFIRVFGMGTTMREGSRDYFYQALDKHYPTLKDRYIKTYGNKYICDSPRSEELWKAFRESCEAYGMLYRHEAIDALFELRKTTQMTLF